MQISTAKGEALRQRMRGPGSGWCRNFGLGITFRCVSFADHRSGTAALSMIIELGFWHFQFYPLKWKQPFIPEERVWTLREQIEATHKSYDDEDEDMY